VFLVTGDLDVGTCSSTVVVIFEFELSLTDLSAMLLKSSLREAYFVPLRSSEFSYKLIGRFLGALPSEI
jgi:hypothetical protein